MTENQKRIVPIFFRLPKELDLKLRRQAASQERNLAQQLRHLIREAVSNEHKAYRDASEQ